MKRALAHLVAACPVLAASLVGATRATAMAQSESAPQTLPRAVTLVGGFGQRTVSERGRSADAPAEVKSGAYRGTSA
jgi:hypothetical protein